MIFLINHLHSRKWSYWYSNKKKLRPNYLFVLWFELNILAESITSNQTVQQVMLMQEIWNEVIVTLKSQYDGVERQ